MRIQAGDVKITVSWYVTHLGKQIFTKYPEESIASNSTAEEYLMTIHYTILLQTQ